MRNLIAFARAWQWPAVFLALTLLTHDKWNVTAFTLALAFRSELAAVLLRRRIEVGWPGGFRGLLDGGDADEPGRAAMDSPAA